MSDMIVYNELLPLGIRLESFDIEKATADTDYEKKKEEEYQEFVEELKRQTIPYDV